MEPTSQTVCEGEDGQFTVDGQEFPVGGVLTLEEATERLEASGIEADQAAILVAASEAAANTTFDNYITSLEAGGATCFIAE